MDALLAATIRAAVRDGKGGTVRILRLLEERLGAELTLPDVRRLLAMAGFVWDEDMQAWRER